MSSHASKQAADDKGGEQPESLNQAEHDVLVAIAAGASRADIAESLSVSEEAVGAHIAVILDKLHRLNNSKAVPDSAVESSPLE